MSAALRLVFFLAGSALLVTLVVNAGLGAIATVLSRCGWRMLWLVPLHGLPLLLDARGWQLLVPRPVLLRTLFVIAAVREAVNRLLPVANIGGEIVGVRLLTAQGIAAANSAASVIVEVVLTMVSQFVFLALGAGCLIWLVGMGRVGDAAKLLWAGLALIALLVLLFQHGGAVMRRMAAVVERRCRANSQIQRILSHAASVDTAVRALFTPRGRLARVTMWQTAGLIVGCAETWLALRWLGHPVSVAAAIALESLAQVARHFVFFIPLGLGVQEAGLIGVGAVLGVSSEIAVAVSLVKRAREVLFGLPALAAWYRLEGLLVHARGTD